MITGSLRQELYKQDGSKGHTEVPGGGGDSHAEQTGMLVGNFEFNP